MLDSLHLAIAPPAATQSIGTARRTPSSQVDHAVRRIVWHRDGGACRYCGFRSLRYQEVVVIGGNARDVDTMATACQFCHQCLNLTRVSSMRSGVLIWLPELTQADLHHVMRGLYLARLSHRHSSRANAALDALEKRREDARDRLGSDDPRVLAERLEAAGGLRESVLPPELEAGIRLMPINRRIVAEEDLEFNEFPQVLAYWRSSEGPFARGPDLAVIDLLDRTLTGRSAVVASVPASSPGPEPTAASLAVKLLRDAATFFDTFGKSNPDSHEQMATNAKVFRQIADLLERDPDHMLGTEEPDGSDRRVSKLAARLLADAAAFFESLSAQTPQLKEQMASNADVFRWLGERVRDDPHGVIPDRH